MAMTLDDYRDQIKSDIKEYLTQENLWPTAEPGTSEYDEQRDTAYGQQLSLAHQNMMSSVILLMTAAG